MIIQKSYASRKLTYQLTPLGFRKLLAFDTIGYWLGYTKSIGMVEAHLTIILLDEEFAKVSQATQIEIINKSYTPGKLMRQLTTSSFTKLFSFHHIGWCLGYIVSKGFMFYIFTILFLGGLFRWSIKRPKHKSYAKSYAPVSWHTNLPL